MLIKIMMEYTFKRRGRNIHCNECGERFLLNIVLVFITSIFISTYNVYSACNIILQTENKLKRPPTAGLKELINYRKTLKNANTALKSNRKWVWICSPPKNSRILGTESGWGLF